MAAFAAAISVLHAPSTHAYAGVAVLDGAPITGITVASHTDVQLTLDMSLH